MAKVMKTMDGNQAAAHAAYAFTEVAGIYPITPSSNMAEYTDQWASYGKKNLLGTPVKVVEMQSEAGAAGTVHGSLQAGALTTTFTASQGLLLKIPNMYKIAGELLPGVMHVAARSISAQALSIFGDHQDIYAVRMTGWAMMSTSSVQEVMDLAGIAHLTAIKSRVPMLHFFDGFRTSHEINKVEVIDYEVFDRLLDREAVKEFRERAINPERPVTRGSAQNDDVYFQAREAQNRFYEAVPDIVNDYMKEITKETGRYYAPFVYYGAEDAERVIIAMGSVNETIRETVDYLAERGVKVGLLTVHLYRPFSRKYFFEAMPETVKKIAVLDRTKEPGALGEPLYMDVRSLYYGKENPPIIVGGRYGLSSKDTTVEQILAVYKNLAQPEPKDHFTIGIVDDVTFTSLPLEEPVFAGNKDVKACLFYGLGSDGTVGANKNSIKIIGDKTDMYAQGYFAYDSKKSGGVTRSHLRFSKDPIRSTYLVTKPSFVACSVPAYVGKYDMISGLREGGIFLLNTIWDKEKLVQNVPNEIKRELAKKKARFFIINATKLAQEIGLGTRTNTIMQSAFFYLTEVIPYEKAKEYMKEYAEKTYGRKGKDIVEKNFAAIDKGTEGLEEVFVDPEWVNLEVNEEIIDSAKSEFIKKIADPINAIKGNELPVSAFIGYEDGTLENGTANYEKRGIAVEVPEWQPDMCIQCNQCAYVCPHAAIRPFLLDEQEMAAAPKGMPTIKALGKGFDNLKYKIQVSPLDCTGCTSCVDVCPAPRGKAIVMKPIESQIEKHEVEYTDYLYDKVSYKDHIMGKGTVKGSQFSKPLFEFSGACAGCGETPYIKLVTQLFGERMLIANATGCSSIYGGSAPSTPYTKNSCGEGPAWASSLFEDNAEYGYGMFQAVETIRHRMAKMMIEAENEVSSELAALFAEWRENISDGEKTTELRNKIVPLLEKETGKTAKELLELKQYLVKKSIWMFGGDGWAYDIGYGGIDHVLASGDDVNILVLDTEVYSNTGGQSSKSSPAGSVGKFASSGKPVKKKDLAAISMTYGNIYVARVSMGANQNQTLKAIKEAEAYPGPSIIIAYSPCIAHGLKEGLGKSQHEEKLATEVGYWPILRYDPRLAERGKNPLQLDSRDPAWDKYEEFLKGESRYNTLLTEFPEHAKQLFEMNLKNAKDTWNYYKRLASMDYSLES